MKLSIDELTTDRQWRASTGYSKEKFLKLLAYFEPIYTRIQGDTIEVVKAKSPRESAIKTCEELLLFTLFSLKSGLTYDVLGFVTGMDGSNAKRHQDLGVRILKEALRESGVAPKREFQSVEDFEAHFAGSEALLIDGTEHRIERPQAKDNQKQNYSGKKKLTPLKQRSSRRKTSASGS